MSGNGAVAKVFMSYSWTNPEHIEWVEALAERLMSNGVEVIFDQWDLKKGHDKFVFMEKMVTDPDVKKVLCVCDKLYAAKADGREGGVGTESQIISTELYEKVTQEKFIALVREKDEHGKAYLPIFFGNRMYYDFASDEQFEDEYETLLRDISGAPKKKRPPLGKLPSFITQPDAPHLRTAAILHRLRDSIHKSKPQTPGLIREYCETFTESLEDYRITFDRSPEWDEAVIASITAFIPYRDNFIEFLLLLCTHVDGAVYEQELHDCLENILAYQNKPDGVTAWSELSFDNYRFINYEIFLYTIAVLIRTKQSNVAANLIEAVYFLPRSLRGHDIQDVGASEFNDYNNSLDEFRKRRLNSNRISHTADLIQERANHPKVPFLELLQIDFILWMRPRFPGRGHFHTWYPHCAGYMSRGSSAFPLFARAVSPAGLEQLKHILKITSLQDLCSRLQAFLTEPKSFAATQYIPFFSSSVIEFVNFERLSREVSGR